MKRPEFRGHNTYLYALLACFGLGPGLARASFRLRRFSSRATHRGTSGGLPEIPGT